MSEHITYDPTTNDFDVDRKAIINKYGIGEGFAAGNVLLYEHGHISLEELKARSVYPRFSASNYKPNPNEWGDLLKPIIVIMGWKP